LQEDGVRYLFGIPYEHPQEVDEVDEPPDEACEGNPGSEDGAEGVNENELKVHEQVDRPESRASEHPSTREDMDLGDSENPEEDEHPTVVEEPKKVIMIPVPLPDELVGDTLLFLLESMEIKKLMKEENAEKPFLHTADDYIRMKVGPEGFQDARDTAPTS